MHLELEFLITLQAQRVKLSPPSLSPASFCSRVAKLVTYDFVLKFGTVKRPLERNIQRMLFCSERFQQIC